MYVCVCEHVRACVRECVLLTCRLLLCMTFLCVDGESVRQKATFIMNGEARFLGGMHKALIGQKRGFVRIICAHVDLRCRLVIELICRLGN